LIPLSAKSISLDSPFKGKKYLAYYRHNLNSCASRLKDPLQQGWKSRRFSFTLLFYKTRQNADTVDRGGVWLGLPKPSLHPQHDVWWLNLPLV
jgi:hypothetical protein